MTRPSDAVLRAELERTAHRKAAVAARETAIRHVLYPQFAPGHARHAEAVEKAWREYEETSVLTPDEVDALAELEARAEDRGWRREPTRLLVRALRRLAGL